MDEPILDAALPICDPHHHLYPNASPIHGRYLLDDLGADVHAGHNIVKTIYVETSGSVYRERGPAELRPVGETAWVAELAHTAAGSIICGIVAYANLVFGRRARPILEEHLEAADGLLVGTRFRNPVVGQLPSPYDFPTTREFRSAAAVVEELGLVLELFVMFDLLPSVARFAASAPELRIVIDHLGCPSPPDGSSRETVLEPWRAGLRELARNDNVFLKLGGVGNRNVTDLSAFPGRPTATELAAHWRDEFAFAIETFGPARCMFESNFPIDSAVADYATLWNMFKLIATDASPDEKAALFHDTAARVYGIA